MSEEKIILSEQDPHHDYLIANCLQNHDIAIFDIREGKNKYLIRQAHNREINDLDFNPNKQYYFVTASEDGLVKFWDLRKNNLPVKVLDEFNNM